MKSICIPDHRLERPVTLPDAVTISFELAKLLEKHNVVQLPRLEQHWAVDDVARDLRQWLLEKRPAPESAGKSHGRKRLPVKGKTR